MVRLIGLVLLLSACTGPSTAPAEPEAPAAPQASVAPAPGAPVVQASTAKIDVNTATGEALATATGAGPRMVHEFEEYRPYVSIRQFRKEIGKYVDEATVASYEQRLYVPVAINDSDVATVQQLPGVDAAKAQALVDGRPYADLDAFAKALQAQVTADELASGRAWLRAK